MTKTLCIAVAALVLSGCDRVYSGQQTQSASEVTAACSAAGGRARYADSWSYPGSLEIECVIPREGK
jgi:hypothetical protein